MRFSVDVRCLSCGHDELSARSEDDDLECLSRAHARCVRCGKVWRVSVSMVPVKAERMVVS